MILMLLDQLDLFGTAAEQPTVEVVQADRDNDGILDEADQCFDQAGPAENNGCPWPDSDGDGILDDTDQCFDQAGPAENNGCPWPDSDGDGIPDKDDVCPAQGDAGYGVDSTGCPVPPPDSDGDGIPDMDDACAGQAGPAENNGCPWPDGDGDDIPDKDDACPAQGDAGYGLDSTGCPVSPPDADNDGVLDDADVCPEQGDTGYGLGSDGCPLPPPDADGDGVPDARDGCPDRRGPVENNGCPWSGGDGEEPSSTPRATTLVITIPPTVEPGALETLTPEQVEMTLDLVRRPEFGGGQTYDIGVYIDGSTDRIASFEVELLAQGEPVESFRIPAPSGLAAGQMTILMPLLVNAIDPATDALRVTAFDAELIPVTSTTIPLAPILTPVPTPTFTPSKTLPPQLAAPTFTPSKTLPPTFTPRSTSIAITTPGLPITGGGPGCAVTYTIQPGDTLIGIAVEYSVNINTLIEINGLDNQGLIYVGQTLCIPGGFTVPTPVPSGPTQERTPTPKDIPEPIATVASATPTNTPPAAPVEIAAVPVTVRNISGAVVGVGTLRLYAPEQVAADEGPLVELELDLTERFVTPTPAGPVQITPLPPTTRTPLPGRPSPTPRTLIEEQPGQAVYERMGASLTCLSSSFEGCDDLEDPASLTRLLQPITKKITSWSWPLKAQPGATGPQHLKIELWRLEVIEAIETRAIEWSYPFTIDILPESITPTAAGSTAGGVKEDTQTHTGLLILGAVAAVTLAGGAGFVLWKRRRPQPLIFISYQRSTGWTMARTLRDRLAALGADVFIDVESLHEGRFGERIQNAILRAEHFVVVLAPGTLNSEWVRKEAALAIAHEKNIVPVLIEGFDLYANLPDDVKGLANFNAIRFDPEYFDAAFDKLADFVGLKPKK